MIQRPSELDRLRDQVAQLETLLGLTAAEQFSIPLRPAGARLFGLLLTRASATVEAMILALYASRPECDLPATAIKIVHVELCHLRKTLKPHGIEIVTHFVTAGGWRGGTACYAMPPKSKEIARSMFPQAERPAA